MNCIRQHTVQRRLLKNFAINDQIWTHDKICTSNLAISINDASVNLRFLDGLANDIITQIERECFPAITRIAEKKMIYPSSIFNEREILENQNCLYRYIAAQLCRTPWYRKNYLLHLNNPKQIQGQLFTESIENYETINFGFGRVQSQHENFGKMSTNYYNALKQWNMVKLKKFDIFAASLLENTLPIVVTNTTSIPYIQNDIGLCPFFPIGDTTKNLKYRTERGTKLDILCVFPIDPIVIICLCTHKSIKEWTDLIPPESNQGLRLLSLDEEDVKFTNYWMYDFALHFIYSNKEFSYQLIQSHAHMPPFSP